MSHKIKNALIYLIVILFSSAIALNSPQHSHIKYKKIHEFLTMSNGTKISVTYYLPSSINRRIPVLLELLPYRKDDLFAQRDQELYSYFYPLGYALVSADIRGTGSSMGAVPNQEYSKQEIQDATEIITQISRKPWSNGKVGMWGISWGGFNSIITAFHDPAALKAILAVDATDDLFNDDIHYIDGIMHVDEYESSMEGTNLLPRSPNYVINDNYFKGRFDSYPWFLQKMQHQTDGSFWREKSLRWQYEKLKIPAFLVGGLYDGYRDSVPRMLEHTSVPMIGLIGPWNHSWPQAGDLGPHMDWRNLASIWWEHWLNEKTKSWPFKKPLLFVYLRDGNPPSTKLRTIPGRWIMTNWPIPNTCWEKFYLNGNHLLLNKSQKPKIHNLKYIPTTGIEAGFWWGEVTSDMKENDKFSLVYDSPFLKKEVSIIGMPRIHIKVSANAKLANWIVRLEDVFPDGSVSLVTGGALNGSQRFSRLHPTYLVPGKKYNISFALHFTTWTFKPGHHIRIAVTNAQFPMFWPTPYPMTTQLYAGTNNSFIELPTINASQLKKIKIPPFNLNNRLKGEGITSMFPQKIMHDTKTGTVSVEWNDKSEHIVYTANEKDPAHAFFIGTQDYFIHHNNRTIHTHSHLKVDSDEKNFQVNIERFLYINGKLIRKRIWTKTFLRIGH